MSGPPQTLALERYAAAVGGLGIAGDRYVAYSDRLFHNVPLDGRILLDVGGGSGLTSFYAAARGAEVVCLEPSAAGSNPAMEAWYRHLEDALGDRARVRVDRRPVQELEASAAFDVIVLHNSVNHLDERACTALRTDPEARKTYVGLFRSLRAATRAGGDLIVADCARLNLFGVLRLRNPFVPDVEWPLHQQPRVWRALIEEAGFVRSRVQWNPMTRAGRPGRLLLANWPGAFATTSHFTLTAHGRGLALARAHGIDPRAVP